MEYHQDLTGAKRTVKTSVLNSRPRHLPLKICFHRRPFADNDAVGTCISEVPIGENLIIPQNSVQLGAQSFDSAPAGMIKEVRAQFHTDAIQEFEGMRKQ